MYWWHKAAERRAKGVKQFGFISTNSMQQTFNRRIVRHHLKRSLLSSLLQFQITHGLILAMELQFELR